MNRLAKSIAKKTPPEYPTRSIAKLFTTCGTVLDQRERAASFESPVSVITVGVNQALIVSQLPIQYELS